MLFVILNVLFIILLVKTNPKGYEKEKTDAILLDVYGQCYPLGWNSSFGYGNHVDYPIHAPNRFDEKILRNCFTGETFFEIYYSEGSFRLVSDTGEDILLQIISPGGAAEKIGEEPMELVNGTVIRLLLLDFDIQLQYRFILKGV